MSKRSMMLTPRDFASLTKLATVSTITIKSLEFALADLANTPGAVNVMLQGVSFDVVPFADIDAVENIGKFSIDANNDLVLIVDTVRVPDEEAARKYIWGLAVIYQLKELIVADNIPSYICRTYDTMGYLVSETLPASQAELMNKIRCLDSSLDVNEVFYHHVLTRNVT